MSALQVTRAGLALIVAILAGGTARADGPHDRTSFAPALRAEASKAGLPFDIADTVMAIESGYDPTRIGGVGEIGLMQVRPATAAMLGFKGTAAELAKPEVNIHFGVTYLAEAWRRADGDVCRALMKYRAGHGEEVMTPLSRAYCERARLHLAGIGSGFARTVLRPAATPQPNVQGTRKGGHRPNPLIGMSSAAFWAAHTARILRIDAQVERHWRRVATR